MRKHHRKTRTGCVQCKQRRIKCDEIKPSCLNCSRRSADCSLTFLTPAAPNTRYLFQFQDRVTTAANKNALKASQTLSDNSKTPGLELLASNHELLQHYTMVAHRTISGIRSPELWQFTVPQLAVQFPFLMHGMLALSALHLAKLQPERRRELITKATTNESQALPSYRSTMKNPNQENIHAIFAFSGFVAQYSLAASKSWSYNDNRSTGVIEYETIDDLPEFPPNWFHITRGTSIMVYSYYMLLMRGPFGKVLALQPGKDPFEWNPDDIYLKALEPLFYPTSYSPNHPPPSESSSSPESSYDSPPTLQSEADRIHAKHMDDLKVCATALYTIRRTFVLRFSGDNVRSKTIDDMAAWVIWPGIVDKSYIRLLTNRKPEALILFAHYCVLLSYCDYAWYFRGVGKRLIAAIWRSLGPEWRPWISWPVTVTGAVVDELVGGHGDGGEGKGGVQVGGCLGG